MRNERPLAVPRHHLVGKQNIVVRTGSVLLGPALLDRIGDVNRTRLLPVVARVLDDFDPQGAVIRIDALHVDLGRLGADLAGIEERLASRLRAALHDALPSGSGTGDGRAGSVPRATALVEAFEHYLLHGVWPYHAGIDRDATPASCLTDLIHADPAELVAMLRRHQTSDPALSRLIRQLPDALIGRLLHCLEPAHAAYVIGFIEVRASHAITPIIAATPEKLAEMLWQVVLRDALQSGGLRANRKAFLKHLLGALARSAGVSVEALIRQLHRGLLRRKDRARPGSLLDILSEIIVDERAAGAKTILADLAGMLNGKQRRDRLELRRLLTLALAIDPTWTRRMLRRRARGDASAVQRIADPPVRPSEFGRCARGPLPSEASSDHLIDTASSEHSIDADGSVGTSATGSHDRRRTNAKNAASTTVAHHDVDEVLSFSRPASTRLSTGNTNRAHPHRDLPLSTSGSRAIVGSALSDPSSMPSKRPALRGKIDQMLRSITEHAPSSSLRTGRGIMAAALRNPAPLAQIVHGLSGEEAIRLADAITRVIPERIWPEAHAAASDRFIEALRYGGVSRARLRVLAQRASMSDPAGTRRMLRAMIADDPARYGDILGLPLLFTAALPSHLAAPLDALIRTCNCSRVEWKAVIEIVARSGDTNWPAALIGDAIAALATARGVSRSEQRRIVETGLVDLAPDAAEALAGALGRGCRAAAPDDLIASVLAAPDEAFASIASLRPAAYASALPALLTDPAAVDATVRLLPPDERGLVSALARLLTAHRIALPRQKVARAFALTAGARDWRGAEGFAAQWLKTLVALATLAEQAALARALDRQWPDTAINAMSRRKLALPLGPLSSSPKEASKAGPMFATGIAGMQRGAIRRSLRDPRERARASAEMSEGDLRRLLMLLAPMTAGALLRAAELIAAARTAAGARLERSEFWQAILAVALDHPGDVAPLLSRLLDGIDGIVPPLDAARRRAALLSLQRALDGERDAPLRLALAARSKSERQAEPPAPSGPPPLPDSIFVPNAGLVLAAGFLPRLFSTLGYLAHDGSGRLHWIDPAQRDRAVHLLQWLSDEREAAPEPLLALNKILCGLHPSEPVCASVVLSTAERAAGESLLRAILGNWPPLAQSSIGALRETFLQREGRLERNGEDWSLDVERKTLDILLDQLPWSFSMILHPWMVGPLIVRW